jgi:hypothetical protein
MTVEQLSIFTHVMRGWILLLVLKLLLSDCQRCVYVPSMFFFSLFSPSHIDVFGHQLFVRSAIMRQLQLSRLLHYVGQRRRKLLFCRCDACPAIRCQFGCFSNGRCRRSRVLPSLGEVACYHNARFSQSQVIRVALKGPFTFDSGCFNAQQAPTGELQG